MNSIYLLATERCFTLDKFKDIYNILKNNAKEITLDKLYSISVKYEIVPYVFYVLYYTGQVYDDGLLRRYTEAFRTPEGEALLNCYGLCEKEQNRCAKPHDADRQKRVHNALALAFYLSIYSFYI